MKVINYKWCSENAKTDKEFLGWIFERLQTVFGEQYLSHSYMRRLASIIDSMPGDIPDKLTKILESNPDLNIKREAFREALANLGHSEATCYNHWALEAFDRAHNLRE